MTKNRVLQIRVTEDEHAAVVAHAANANRTVSDWARGRLNLTGRVVAEMVVTPTGPTIRTGLEIAEPIPDHIATPQEAAKAVERISVQPYTKAMQAGRKPKP